MKCCQAVVFAFISASLLAETSTGQSDGRSCTPWGYPCNNSLTTCCSEGSWPGGRQNCYGSPPYLYCYCTIPGSQCQSDRQCCSNKCAKGKCDVGWKNDICDPKSKQPQCGEGLSCTPFAIEVGKIYEMFGECLPKDGGCEGYGSLCYSNTQCCPIGSWKGQICQPASKNVVDSSQTFCHCRVDYCLDDDDCCSGKCAQNTCAPGNIDDFCDLEKGKNACKAGLKCVGPIDNVNIQRFLDKNELYHYGRCYRDKVCLEFGAECSQNDLTPCCSYGKWPGGPFCRRSRNPHLRGRLFCLCSLYECRDNNERCSGSCVKGMCTSSTEQGSICSNHPSSCTILQCGLTMKESKFNDAVRLHRLSDYGQCPLRPVPDVNRCVPLDGDCLSDSILCDVPGAPNIVCLYKPERTKRGFEGKSGCLGYYPNSTVFCTSDSQCCSGSCFRGQSYWHICLPSGLDQICPLDDIKSPCMPGLTCTPDRSLNSRYYGYCKLDPTSVPVGSKCGNGQNCAAVGGYPGGINACSMQEDNDILTAFDNNCGCRVSANYENDRVGCSIYSNQGALTDICHYGKTKVEQEDDLCTRFDKKTSCKIVPSSLDGPMPYWICWSNDDDPIDNGHFTDYSQQNKQN